MTNEQIKAIKDVRSAVTAARKAGVTESLINLAVKNAPLQGIAARIGGTGGVNVLSGSNPSDLPPGSSSYESPLSRNPWKPKK
jgi:hypothetical protein